MDYRIISSEPKQHRDQGTKEKRKMKKKMKKTHKNLKS